MLSCQAHHPCLPSGTLLFQTSNGEELKKSHPVNSPKLQKCLHSHYTVCHSYVYWTVHHLDSWIKRDQLDVTCFIISLFNAQHVSDVNTSILRSSDFVELFHGSYCSIRIEVFALACLFSGRVFSRDVCGCIRKRVSAHIHNFRICSGNIIKKHTTHKENSRTIRHRSSQYL